MTVTNPSVALRDVLRSGQLYSHFQPIFDLHTGIALGHEALIRTPRKSPLPTPKALFDAADDQQLTAELDLHCCRTHVSNFAPQGLHSRLFMNLNPAALMNGSVTGHTLLNCVDHAGLDPSQLVVEITEHTPVADYAKLRDTLNALRQAGVDVALDDLGSGYSGLRQWSELQPQFVKIDAHFVREVNTCSNKRQFIHSIVEMARALGSRVIAEGIETPDELETVQTLGVNFGQGYLLGRPARAAVTTAKVRWRDRTTRRPSRTSQTVSAILSYTPAITPDTPVSEVKRRFDERHSLRCLVICDEGRPQGIVSRSHLTSVFASLYGRELFSRRPVSELMETSLIQVKASTQLEELSERLTSEYEYLPEQDLVVTDPHGSFMGTTSFTRLLRAITELQIRSARYANPLTQLPGSVPLNERIDALLADGESFQVAYCDLDNFKPFNDIYGYAHGDEVLRRLARLLAESMGPEDMVGHIGGDDFILVMRSADWHARCTRVLDVFQALAPNFYSPEDRERGGILSHNRRGAACFFPFLSLSVGVTHADPQEHGSHMEIATTATEVKRQAKETEGNCLFLDRRSSRNVLSAMQADMADTVSAYSG